MALSINNFRPLAPELQMRTQAAPPARLETGVAQQRPEQDAAAGLALEGKLTSTVSAQRSVGTAQDRSGQQASEIAAPTWQSTMNLGRPSPQQNPERLNTNTRQPQPLDDPKGSVGTIVAGRSTVSLGMVNQAGETASSSDSTQGRSMGGERAARAYEEMQSTDDGVLMAQMMMKVQEGLNTLSQANTSAQPSLSLLSQA